MAYYFKKPIISHIDDHQKKKKIVSHVKREKPNLVLWNVISSPHPIPLQNSIDFLQSISHKGALSTTHQCILYLTQVL